MVQVTSNKSQPTNQPNTNRTTSNVKHISIAWLNHIIFPSQQPLLDGSHAADHMDGFGRRCASTRRDSGIPFGSAGSSFSLRVVLEGFEGLMLAKLSPLEMLKKASKIWGFFCGFLCGGYTLPSKSKQNHQHCDTFALLNAFVQWKKKCRVFFAKKHMFHNSNY